jgi:site-specific recombinase XerC
VSANHDTNDAAPISPTPAEEALQAFLRTLAQRNASVHTIKAYRTDLSEFVLFIGPDRPLAHPRFPRPAL